MRIPKQVLLFILFTLGMMKAMGQDSPPPMAMPIQNQKILVDKIIEVTKHQQYFTDYCTKKVSEFAEKENWSKRKTREILHSIRFEDYNSTIYNSYAFYSTEQLTKLLEVLVELNKTTKSWDTFILTNEMMQSNLDLHVKSILEGKYILNK